MYYYNSFSTTKSSSHQRILLPVALVSLTADGKQQIYYLISIICLKFAEVCYISCYLCLNIARRVTNSEDPDQKPHSTAPNLCFHCLLMSV